MAIKTRRKMPIIIAKLVRFLMFNFVGALLPLGFAIFVRRLGAINAPPGVYAPEILFFAVMICATALGDLVDATRLVGQGPLFQILWGALFFGAVGSAGLYGVYLSDQILGSGNLIFRNNITWYGTVIAVFLFSTSLITETVLAFIEGEAP